MARVLALVGTASVLAACGGSDGGTRTDGSDATTADVASDGGSTATDAREYRGELEDGTTLTVRLDVDESDPAVAPFVAYRAEAGATEPVVWIVGALDAPADFDDSAGPPTGRFLTFLPDGADLLEDDATNPKSAFACGELDDWFGTPVGDEAAALNEVYLEVFGENCDGQSLGVVGAVGAVTEYAMVVAGESLPPFTALYAGLLTELEPVR